METAQFPRPRRIEEANSITKSVFIFDNVIFRASGQFAPTKDQSHVLHQGVLIKGCWDLQSTPRTRDWQLVLLSLLQ